MHDIEVVDRDRAVLDDEAAIEDEVARQLAAFVGVSVQFVYNPCRTPGCGPMNDWATDAPVPPGHSRGAPIPWWGKVALKLAASRLPISHHRFARLGLFRHSFATDERRVVTGVQHDVERFRSCHGRLPRRILELGPGEITAKCVTYAGLGIEETIFVDAGDYVVWRKTNGQTGVTPGSGADGDGNGTINSDDFTFWRARFGNPAGSGSGSLAVGEVPEPSTSLLALLAVVATVAIGRDRRSSPGSADCNT